MRSKMFHSIVIAALAAMAALAAAATAAAQTTPKEPPPKFGPPSTNQPFPTDKNISNFPAGQMTLRLQIENAVTDGGWAKYTLYIANRTARDKLFTKTGLSVALDGRRAEWAQTTDNTGGFSFVDKGHWWIRSGTMRSGRVIKITGLVQIPSRTQFVSGNPLRDSNFVCVQAKAREAIIGQPEENWPETYSKIDRHSCAQFAS